MPIAQRYNSNAISTSEELDKLDELVDAFKNLTINKAEYYDSNTATASDAQGNLTSDPKTFTQTRNIIFEPKLLSCRIIPIFPPTMNPGIEEII